MIQNMPITLTLIINIIIYENYITITRFVCEKNEIGITNIRLHGVLCFYVASSASGISQHQVFRIYQVHQ